MRRLSLLLPLLALLFAAAHAAPEYPQQGPDIYDTHADASVDIAAALARAKAEHKNVLLDFGANWCPWCHKLHKLFTTGPAVSAALQRDYILVMVDVNSRHETARNTATDARYGHPIQHGLPVLVVLDADGNRLTTQDTGELEDGDRHSPSLVLDFLAHWAPAP